LAILTNGYTVEYGSSAGFIANLVTKSGNNDYHGSLYDCARNSALAANSFESRMIARLGLQFGANYTWSHSIDNASERSVNAGDVAQSVLLD
jgi:hypothetical protein